MRLTQNSVSWCLAPSGSFCGFYRTVSPREEEHRFDTGCNEAVVVRTERETHDVFAATFALSVDLQFLPGGFGSDLENSHVVIIAHVRGANETSIFAEADMLYTLDKRPLNHSELFHRGAVPQAKTGSVPDLTRGDHGAVR